MPGRQQHLHGGGSNFYRQGAQQQHPQGGRMTRNIGEQTPQTNGTSRREEERVIRERHRKQVKLDSYLADDENFPTFRSQMAKLGLQLRDIPADGNCLFRALGDQLEGHCRNHFKHRSDVVTFMRGHRVDFEPFVEDDVKFEDHIRNLSKLSTHAGNDAIVAFSKMHGVNTIIHQLNGKPLLISGSSRPAHLTRQLHIAYHNGDHYSSVRQLDDNTESPADIRLQGENQDQSQSHAPTPGSGLVSVHRGLEDIESEVVMATNCTDVDKVRQVLLDCDYDVDASIADLLQQMELTSFPDDLTSLASEATTVGTDATGDSGWTATDSNSSSPTNSNGRASALKNSSGNVNGKGHKVHFREDSIGGSSGYGSMSSNKGGGARPKMAPVVQLSAKKMKEAKKLDKKRRAEERHRQKYLNLGLPPQYPAHLPQASDVRDVGVVEGGRYTHVITMPGHRLTSI